MDNDFQKQEEAYLHRVRQLLPCGERTKRKLLADLHSSIEEYRAIHPDQSFAAVEEAIGSPAEIAGSFLTHTTDTSDRGARQGPAKKIIVICLVTLLICLLAITAVIVINKITDHTYIASYSHVVVSQSR